MTQDNNQKPISPHKSVAQTTRLARLKGILKPLLNRLRILPPKILGRLLPYPVGARLLERLCRTRWVQLSLFRRQLNLLHQGIAALNLTPGAKHIIQHSLRANFLRFYRLAALAYCPSERINQWLQVEGLELLQDAHRQGKGVIILNSHTTLAHILSLALSRNGFNELLTVGDDAMKLDLLGMQEVNPASATVGAPKIMYFLRQLQEAKRILKQGGVVQVAADGSYGASIVEAPFFGHRRPFRTGFAELSATTGAVSLPAIVTIMPGGVVRVVFHAPFLDNPPESGQRAQVAALMSQYIDFNRRLWSSQLGDLKWRQIQRFLDLPLLDSEASAAEKTDHTS